VPQAAQNKKNVGGLLGLTFPTDLFAGLSSDGS